MSYCLAIDQGTHASRALLFDHQGHCVASHSQDVDLQRPAAGRVEQDAAQLLRSVTDSIAALLTALSPAQRDNIATCGLCCQRSTVVACDHSGQALGPALSWQDVRGKDFLASLENRRDAIQRLSGLPLSAHYGASKMRWLRRHLDAEDLRLAPLVSYLLLNLVDQQPYCVDHSNAQRTQLLDLASLQWSQQLSDWFQVPVASLPACRPMCDNYGTLQQNDIPLTAVCGDQNAAMFGAGNLPDDTALINLGSGAFILRHLDKLTPSPLQLTGIAVSDQQSVRYLREATINGAGSALDWATQQWQINDMKKQLPAWLDKVRRPAVFINSVGGLGSPWWQSSVTPQLTASETFDQAQRAVAVVESIVFLIQDNLTLMNEEKPLQRLRVSGGLSQLDGLCRKLANLSRLPVERLDNPEATARGIAWLAANRPAHWVQPETVCFEPQEDTALLQRYDIFCTELAARLNGS